MVNLIKKAITRLSQTPFYNKLKAFMDKEIGISSIPSPIRAIWYFFKNTIYMGRTSEYSKILYSTIHLREPWNINQLRISDTLLEIKGWAIAPQGNHFAVNFIINDEDFDEVKYPSLREDIRDYFWFYPLSAKSGFTCRKKLSNKETFTERPLILKYINKETRQPIYSNHNLYYFKDDLKLPDANRIERISGIDNEVIFRIGGYSAYVKLELAIKRLFNKSFNDISNILDWGCGCGRVARYFKNLKNTSITGVDIDSDNINWCKKYLGFGTYLTIPLHPPTSLKDNFFDLVIGISVFTHLGEKEQYEWLNELRRVTSLGALLLVTIQSDANIFTAKLNIPNYNLWKKKGIYMEVPPHVINKMIKETDYYKATFHTHSYVMKNWSKYFEIVDIIPAYIENLQDLVIMRKI